MSKETHGNVSSRPRGGGERLGTTVRGMLILADWDEEAEVRRLAVLTDDDDEFVIDDEDYNHKLYRHLEDEVVLWGEVARDNNGTKLLRPSGVQIVDWFEDSGDELDTYDE